MSYYNSIFYLIKFKIQYNSSIKSIYFYKICAIHILVIGINF